MGASRRGFIATVIGAAVCPASQWREGEFRIIGPVGESVKRGWILGCWGVDERYLFGTENWCITHLPTGYNIGLFADSMPEAQRMVQRLVAAGDWSRIDGQHHPDVERLGRIVIPMRGDE